MHIKDQLGIIQNLQMSPISQTSFLVGTFFAASYSQTALEGFLRLSKVQSIEAQLLLAL